MSELLDKRKRTSKSFYLGRRNGQDYSAWDGSIGSKHYLDAEGKWQDIVIAHEADVLGSGFDRRFPYLPMGLRIARDGRRRIYPDPRREPDKWVEFKAVPNVMQGLMANWMAGGLAAETADLKASITVETDRVKLNLLYKKAPQSDILAFDVEAQGLDIASLLIAKQGFAILPPHLIDAKGEIRQLAWEYKFGQLIVGLDFQGLEFPVLFDPTIDDQVAAQLDDCYVYGNVHGDPPTGLLTANDDFAAGGQGDDYHVGSAGRFLDADIPQGATISTAYLALQAKTSDAVVVVNTRIRAEKVAGPATFSDLTDFNARTWTTAYVNWDAIPAWTIEDINFSDQIKTVIQEVVDAYTTTAMVIYWDDLEGRSDAAEDSKRRAYSYKTSTTKCAKFHIEYSVAAAAAAQPFWGVTHSPRKQTTFHPTLSLG